MTIQRHMRVDYSTVVVFVKACLRHLLDKRQQKTDVAGNCPALVGSS
jgi:hypothetical protein